MPRSPWNPESRSYEGTAHGLRFKVRRIVRFPFNNNLPLAVVEVRPAPSGSAIHILVRQSLATEIFMNLWLAVTLAFLVGAAWASLFRNQPWMTPLVALAMFGFGWLLANAGLGTEAKRLRDFLAAVAEAGSLVERR